MNAIRRSIVTQFSKPAGLLGRLAGMIMANRSSNIARNNWTIEAVAPRRAECLLEIGCGPGLGLAEAGRLAPTAKLTGLDHSDVMLNQAKARLGKLDLAAELHNRTHVALGEWPDTFDAIWSVNVVQFLDNMDRAFELIHSALKPGGRVVTTYQPRHRNPTRADAENMGERVTKAMAKVGFINTQIAFLSLKPVDAVRVTGFKPS